MASSENAAKRSPDERYYDVSEIAEYLGFDEQTIWKWAREGSIPCFKVGNKYRFRIHEVDAWMEKRRRRPVFQQPDEVEVRSQISGQQS